MSIDRNFSGGFEIQLLRPKNRKNGHSLVSDYSRPRLFLIEPICGHGGQRWESFRALRLPGANTQAGGPPSKAGRRLSEEGREPEGLFPALADPVEPRQPDGPDHQGGGFDRLQELRQAELESGQWPILNSLYFRISTYLSWLLLLNRNLTTRALSLGSKLLLIEVLIWSFFISFTMNQWPEATITHPRTSVCMTHVLLLMHIAQL